MPRIRKSKYRFQNELALTDYLSTETSKRGTTHQRAKVKHKVSESRKKAKKEAKKNTQWKSSMLTFATIWSFEYLLNIISEKDPGIPNNFPYKDQILAEVAAQRRQVRLAH